MLKRFFFKAKILNQSFLLLIPASELLLAPMIMKAEVHSPKADPNHFPVDTAILNTTDSNLAFSPVDSVELDRKVEAVFVLNKQALKYARSFVIRENEGLAAVKLRSERPFRIIDSIFQLYDIPEDLRYLAIVESDLKSSAVSKVGAKGVWQFMPVTARELGLKISGKTDERLHLSKSTVAAAKYLRNLHKIFGDWLLVVAAYNSGPGGVLKAIRYTGARNFWKLQQSLPAESRSHVKRFLGVKYYFDLEP